MSSKQKIDTSREMNGHSSRLTGKHCTSDIEFRSKQLIKVNQNTSTYSFVALSNISPAEKIQYS